MLTVSDEYGPMQSFCGTNVPDDIYGMDRLTLRFTTDGSITNLGSLLMDLLPTNEVPETTAYSWWNCQMSSTSANCCQLIPQEEANNNNNNNQRRILLIIFQLLHVRCCNEDAVYLRLYAKLVSLIKLI